jgi:hypothetical protein
MKYREIQQKEEAEALEERKKEAMLYGMPDNIEPVYRRNVVSPEVPSKRAEPNRQIESVSRDEVHSPKLDERSQNSYHSDDEMAIAEDNNPEVAKPFEHAQEDAPKKRLNPFGMAPKTSTVVVKPSARPNQVFQAICQAAALSKTAAAKNQEVVPQKRKQMTLAAMMKV